MGTKINNLFPQKRESVTVRETFQLNVNPKYQDVNRKAKAKRNSLN